MKSTFRIVCTLLLLWYIPARAQKKHKHDEDKHAADLRIVLIRHGEKPDNGDNLTCQGLNRALQLPAVLFSRFGKPSIAYIPSMNPSKATKHLRMLQTISPFAIKYDLTLNSKFDETDAAGLANDIVKQTGTVLVVWEHDALNNIAKALGVQDKPGSWPDNDYDGIWVITIHKGNATLVKSQEGLKPSAACPM